MKKMIVLFSLLLLVASAGMAADFTGYVTDMKCAKAGKAGPDHAGCAKGCIGGGAEAALVTADGKIYTIDAQDKVKAHAGEKVTISGTEADGKITLKSLKVAS